MPSVNRHVSVVMHMGERFINRQLAGTGVTAGTAPLLLELRDGGPRNPAGLARAVGVDKSHITRALRSLQGAGYVDVAADEADARMLIVTLTAAGHRAAGVAERATLKWLEIVSAGIDPEHLRTVEDVFERFYANGVAHFQG